MYAIYHYPQLCLEHSVHRDGFGTRVTNLLILEIWKKIPHLQNGMKEHWLNLFGVESLEV